MVGRRAAGPVKRDARFRRRNDPREHSARTCGRPLSPGGSRRPRTGRPALVRLVPCGRLARRLSDARIQAIAKAETVRGNAARLLSTPALCLCERRDRRSLVARMLLVDGPRSAPLGSGIRRRVAPCDGNSGAEAAEGAAEPPLPPVTSAPQDLRDVSAVMPVPRLPARPRAAARRLAAATARCASARGRRGRRSRTA